MFATVKTKTTDLILGLKNPFSSADPRVYVKDLRQVLTNDDGRKFKYPKNYSTIVNEGKLEKINSSDSPKFRLFFGKKDKKGNQDMFDLCFICKDGDKSYYTIDFLIGDKAHKNNNFQDYYKPFGFSKKDLETHLPVFEITEQNSKYNLTNSSILLKSVANKESGKVQELADNEGRNGQFLYRSYYKKLSPYFFTIRDLSKDQHGDLKKSKNLEFDKSLISVPIIFITALARTFSKYVSFIPEKIGTSLIKSNNQLARAFGYCLFIPAIVVKNSINIIATTARLPILLFVANEKKYSDAYWTMWKYQFKGCIQEVKNDYNIIRSGIVENVQEEKKDLPEERKIIGTWKELDTLKPQIKNDLNEYKQDYNKSPDKMNSMNKLDQQNDKLIPISKNINYSERIKSSLQQQTSHAGRNI
ncbi:MAG: hypothetical protein KTV77_00955 [Wolbachia endosymbiont of Fragariocoptes setiger]|nr:hypothetical protein [Wolbachia endosymbiont of Fragariocoptes setiger]